MNSSQLNPDALDDSECGKAADLAPSTDKAAEPASFSEDHVPSPQQDGDFATLSVHPPNQVTSTLLSQSSCLDAKTTLMSRGCHSMTQRGNSLNVQGKIPMTAESDVNNGPVPVSSAPVKTVPLRRGSRYNWLPHQLPGAFRISGVRNDHDSSIGVAHHSGSNEAPQVEALPSEGPIIDAVLVTEGTNDPGTLSGFPVATEADPVEFAIRTFRRRAFFLLIIATVVVVITTVSVTARSNGEQLPAIYRNITIREFRDVLLPPSSLEQATLDPLSPQRRALQWLESDVQGTKLLGWRMLQRFSLAVIYFALNGEQWFNRSGWISSQDECSWFYGSSFTVDDEPCDSSGQFVMLGLPDNNLSGSIPRELTLLTKLEVINLRENSVSGSIPDGIESLTNVRSLYLGDNNLDGTFPSQLSFLSKLARIVIEKNSLSGTLPSEIGMLPELTRLEVRTNMLSGSLATEFGLLGKLESLGAGTNWLNGSIPTEVGAMTSLKTLELGENKLTGSIPTEFGLLPRIQFISIDANDGISGVIPSQVRFPSCHSR
jgi:hypothetical protein